MGSMGVPMLLKRFAIERVCAVLAQRRDGNGLPQRGRLHAEMVLKVVHQGWRESMRAAVHLEDPWLDRCDPSDLHTSWIYPDAPSPAELRGRFSDSAKSRR